MKDIKPIHRTSRHRKARAARLWKSCAVELYDELVDARFCARAAEKLVGEKNRRTTYAYREMARALQSDSDYAKSWQANIAMPILDGAGGKLTHAEANKIADDLMRHLWGVLPNAEHHAER